MNPTIEQVEYLKRACGTRRFIYNWGREQWEKQYQAYKLEQETTREEQRVLRPPNALALKKQFHALREEAYPWTYDVTKCVVEGTFDDLGRAYSNFFAGRAEYPKYKKKGKSHESFYLSNDKFTLGSHWIAVPGLGRFILDQRQRERSRQTQKKTRNGQLSRKAAFCRRGESLHSHEKTHPAQAGRVQNGQDSGGYRVM
jgi:putative transposase